GWFLREKAEPMRQRALSAADDEECGELLNDLQTEMRDIERDLDRRLDDYTHTQQFPRPNFYRDCREMLTAIEAYVGAKREYLSTEGSVPSREEIVAELEAIEELGWMGREAAKLFRSLLVDKKTIIVSMPGDMEVLPPQAWLFARCIRVWRNAGLSAGEYAEALADDIGFDGPYDHAVELARNMEVALGREILAHLSDVSKEDRLEFENEVESVRQFLLKELADQRARTRLTVDEDRLVADIEAKLLHEEFQEAFDSLGELDRRLSAPDRALVRRLAVVEEIRCEVAEHLNRLKRTAADEGNPDDLLDIIIDLKGFTRDLPTNDALELVSDDELRSIGERWTTRRQSLQGFLNKSVEPHTEAPATLTPDLVLATVEPPPAQASTEQLAPPMEEDIQPAVAFLQPGERCFGIVKRLAGNHYAGFVTPFHQSSLQADWDVYFRRGAFDGDIWSLEVGDLVELLEIRGNRGYDQPEATILRKCGVDRHDEIRRALEALVGEFVDDIGVIARVGAYKMIISELFGASRLTAEGQSPVPGTLVRFKLREVGDKLLAEVVETVTSLTAGERRAKILGRIAFAPSTTLPSPPVPQQRTDGTDTLRRNPGRHWRIERGLAPGGVRSFIYSGGREATRGSS
ncbi:MAG: hypothetical protein NTY38_09090, partial [Acidobacteria bacterium]|nr:hypothetical protein [Acidobacteriota bacterium]